MAKRYIISDPHFGHFNIIAFANRPFTTVEEMDEGIIERWNSVVNSEDRVFVAGDIAMSRKYVEKIQYCNGHKILLPGNHDIYPAKDYLKYFEDIRAYMVEDNILISHMPLLLGNRIGRFIGNIHGHTHNIDLEDSRYLNISWEKLNGYPILLEDAKDMLISQILNG